LAAACARIFSFSFFDVFREGGFVTQKPSRCISFFLVSMENAPLVFKGKSWKTPI